MWPASAPEARAPPYTIVSSLAAGRTAAMNMRMKTASKPWSPTNDVTRATLAPVPEGHGPFRGSDVARDQQMRDVGACVCARAAGQPAVPPDRPRPRLVGGRGQRAKDDAAHSLDLQRELCGTSKRKADANASTSHAWYGEPLQCRVEPERPLDRRVPTEVVSGGDVPASGAFVVERRHRERIRAGRVRDRALERVLRAVGPDEDGGHHRGAHHLVGEG